MQIPMSFPHLLSQVKLVPAEAGGENPISLTSRLVTIQATTAPQATGPPEQRSP